MRLHARAVEAIERCYPERLAEHVERLAYHALRGEAWEKAVTYLHQAGMKATARLAYREAVADFDQALDALRHLPESRTRTEQAIDLHISASVALGSMGTFAQGVEHDREAEALAEALGDGRRQGRALGRLSLNTWMAGDPDRALELAQRSLVLATAHDDVPFQALANLRLGMVGQVIGEYRRAADRLRQAVESLQGDRRHERVEANVETFAFTQDRLAWCLTELGEFAEAMARADEAGRVARENDDPRSLIVASRSLGLVSLRRGNLSAAIPPLERAVELCRVTPSPSLFDVSAAHLGYAYSLSGRLAEGLALLEEAVADPRATGVANHPLFLAYLGEAHLLAGRRDDALACRPARPRPRATGRRSAATRRGCCASSARSPRTPTLPTCRPPRSTIARPSREPTSSACARSSPTATSVSARSTGAPASGEPAQEHLTTATTMYREMGMTFWLEKAEAAWIGSSLMRCPQCAFENREGVRFCEECGRGLERVCPACGAAVPPGAEVLRRLWPAALVRPDRREGSHSRRLHAQAPRREDPHLQGRPRRRAQAGHRALRRPQGLDGAAR